jgi:cell division protein FtsI/penicillin-binding protein 2
MSEAFVSNHRIRLVSGFVAFAFCVLLTRLFYLHIWEHEALSDYVMHNRKMINVVEGRRGMIVDAQGNLLAATQATYTVGVDPQSFDPKQLPKLEKLASLLKLDVVSVQKKAQLQISKSEQHPRAVRLIRWAVLAKGLNQSEYASVMALKIKGVYGNRVFNRSYPAGTLAAHVLGYVNKESVSVTGVERHFDFYLRGQDGWRETERDGKRQELAQYRGREVPARDGLNLELSINQMVQYFAEEEIARLAKEYDPAGISILVSEPGTGALLAMANYPTYDPNEFYNTKKYPIANQRNRALTDVFEPGSTFKIVPAAAALNEGLVGVEDSFDTGFAQISYRGRRLSLPADHRTYERLSMREIVVKSSNRGAAHLGVLLGEQKLHAYAAAFGFGSLTGCDLGGEVPGVLHPIRQWDGLTITRLPMGHALSATPMQVHSAMSAIANDGILMEPLLAKRVFDGDGQTVLRFNPKPVRRVIQSEVATTLCSMLADVVGEKGTARRAAIENYQVAGKTGTTQKIIQGRYSNTHHVASFSGFFPANKPELVITVVVDEPKLKGVGYGGTVAAPAFRRIAEGCIQYMGIRPADVPADLFATQSYGRPATRLYTSWR